MQSVNVDIITEGVRPNTVVGWHFVQVWSDIHPVFVKREANVHVLLRRVFADEFRGLGHQLFKA